MPATGSGVTGHVLADPIADLRSPSGALISLYLDRPSPGGMAALLTDLLRPVRDAAAGRGRAVEKSVRADAERIRSRADQLEADGAPAYVFFASDLDGIFTLEALSHPVPDVSWLGPRPYLRPLRAAPRPLRAGVIVADRARTRVFTASDDLVEEISPPLQADLGKPNYGGFAGYEEQGARSRAEVESSRMWREAAAVLLDRHLSRPFDYLSIGGHEESIEEVARNLHPYLSRLYRTSFVANPQTLTVPALRAQLTEHAAEVRRYRQEALAGRVCDTAWSDGLAVLGLAPTLAAANAQAVDTLVVAGEFAKPGALCDACGFLARSGSECPLCGAAMFEVGDVVAAAMESVISGGGRVQQIQVPSPLDVAGVGALTRFALPD